MFVLVTIGYFGGEDNPVRSGSGSERRSQEAETLQVVDSTRVGRTHEPRGTSSEYSPLTQLKAKDGVSIKETDNLHKNGRVNGLVGKQKGKMMKIEVSASNHKKSQAKVAESMQWEKRARF